jgi:hypothetical protein
MLVGIENIFFMKEVFLIPKMQLQIIAAYPYIHPFEEGVYPVAV